MHLGCYYEPLCAQCIPFFRIVLLLFAPHSLQQDTRTEYGDIVAPWSRLDCLATSVQNSKVCTRAPAWLARSLLLIALLHVSFLRFICYASPLHTPTPSTSPLGRRVQSSLSYIPLLSHPPPPTPLPCDSPLGPCGRSWPALSPSSFLEGRQLNLLPPLFKSPPTPQPP